MVILTGLRRILRVVSPLMVASVFLGCEFSYAPGQTYTPPPEILAAMEARAAEGLRADHRWVTFVAADPNSVTWNGILVTLDERALLLDREVRQVGNTRRSAGLPGDEATVRAILASPTTIHRSGIPMTPEEAAAWDYRVGNQEAAGPAIVNYGEGHPDEWAGLFFREDGTAVASFTGHVDEHTTRLRALFLPGAVRFEVRQVRWPLSELAAITARLDPEWFREQEIRLQIAGPRPEENRVVLEVSIDRPRPGIEDQIVDHFDAMDRMTVHVTVRNEVDVGVGGLNVRVLSADGAPVPNVECQLDPVPAVRIDDLDAFRLSGADGWCRWDALPAVPYVVEIRRDWNSELMGSGPVQLQEDKVATLQVVVSNLP